MLKSTAPSADQLAARLALCEAMRAFGDRLTPPEQLAVASYLVGQLIALQDQRTMTPAMAFAIVQANLQAGNEGVVNDLINAPAGGHA